MNGCWANIFHGVRYCSVCTERIDKRYWLETVWPNGVLTYRRICEKCKEDEHHGIGPPCYIRTEHFLPLLQRAYDAGFDAAEAAYSEWSKAE